MTLTRAFARHYVEMVVVMFVGMAVLAVPARVVTSAVWPEIEANDPTLMLARMGATGLANRAHEELVAAGARPRRGRRMLSGREALTASEDRVAALAAEGLTNREIAQRLFVTVKAVQWHLRNVYRKLDVSSRTELPGALGLATAA